MHAVQRKLGINLIWNTLNTWGGTGLTLLASIIYARLLQPEQWGIYSLFTWMVANFALLINLGWNLTINKFVAEAAGQERPQRGALVFQSVVLIELIGAVLLGIIVLVFNGQIAAALGHPEVGRAMPLIVLGVLAMVFYTTTNMVLIALQRYKWMSLTILLTSSISLLCGILWLLNGRGVYGLLAITATANLINAGVSLALISRELPVWTPPRFDRELFVAMGKYVIDGTLILIMMQIVYERTEIFFLSRSQPAEQVGYYSLAVAMTNIAINSIPNIVIGPLLAMTADLYSRNDTAGMHQLFRSATRLLIFIAPPVGIGGALVAHSLIHLMYGDSYMPVAAAAMLLLPPAAVMMVGKPATSLLWGMGKQRLMLKALVLGAILNLGLDGLVIPTYGLYGAAVASSFAQTITTLYLTYICLSFLKYEFPWSTFIRATLAALCILPFGIIPTFWLNGVALLAVQMVTGMLIYPVALVALRAIAPEDTVLLGGLERRLPAVLQAPFAMMLRRYMASIQSASPDVLSE